MFENNLSDPNGWSLGKMNNLREVFGNFGFRGKHCCHFGPNFLFESEFGLFAVKGSENSQNFVKKSEFFKDLNLTIHE